MGPRAVEGSFGRGYGAPRAVLPEEEDEGEQEEQEQEE